MSVQINVTVSTLDKCQRILNYINPETAYIYAEFVLGMDEELSDLEQARATP
jgi:hypothetical protein